MTKYFFIFLMIILFSAVVTASESDDGLTATHPFMDSEGSAVQGGMGAWDGLTNPTISARELTTNNYNTVIISDLDDQDGNEYVVQDNTTLKIFRIDNNNNFVLDTSVEIGKTTHPGTSQKVYATPGVLQHNSTHSTIATLNATHYLSYLYNDGSLTLNKSEELNHTQAMGVFYPRIICRAGSHFEDSHAHCFFTYPNQVGGVMSLKYYEYDTNDTELAQTANIRNLNTNLQWHHTPHVIDYDSDSHSEMLFSAVSTGYTPADLYVDACEINSTGALLCANVYFGNNLGSGHNDYTDIIVSNIDGTLSNGYEISMGYSDDGTNWYIRSVSREGTVFESSYWNVISAPEGDWALRNLLDVSSISGTSPCDEISGVGTNAVAMLVHDDTAGESTLACASLYAGTRTSKFDYDDSSEFTSSKYGILARLPNDTTYDIAYSNVILDVSEEALTMSTNRSGAVFSIPLDEKSIGFTDLITMNGTQLAYYDDGLVNENVEYSEVGWSSGNPVCNNTLVRFDVTVTDAENDKHHGWMEVLNANGTSIYNSTNTSTSINAPHNHQFTYTFTSVDAFIVRFHFRDQYHDTLVEYDYNLWTDTPPDCFGYNQGGSSDEIDEEAEASKQDFEDNVDDVFADVGIESTTGKAMFWLILMMCLAFLIFSSYNGQGVVYIIAFLEVVMLVLGWTLGMIGTVVLVMVGLVAAVLLTFLWMKGPGEG